MAQVASLVQSETVALPNMLDCSECVPPPDFDLPPPPDPSLIWTGLSVSERQQLAELSESCEAQSALADLFNASGGSYGLNNGSGSNGASLLQQYFAFAATAVAVMVLVTLMAIFCALRVKKRSKQCGSSPQKNQAHAPKSASGSTSSGSCMVDGKSQNRYGNAKDGNALASTNWSYNSMKFGGKKPGPAEPGHHHHQHMNGSAPKMHQASSLGMLMYGQTSSHQNLQHGNCQNGISTCVTRPSHLQAPLSCRTLPKRPRGSMSIPNHLQQNNLSSDDERTYTSRVYEEIQPRNYDRVLAAQQMLMMEGPLPPPGRKPPPVYKPPPPPPVHSSDFVVFGAGPNPGSSQGSPCSCSSHCSTSLDGELEHIHLTPSPKRCSEMVHQSSNLRGTQGTQVPDDNGRESGYGTEGRLSRPWDSPRLRAKKANGTSRNGHKMNTIIKDDQVGNTRLTVYGSRENGGAMINGHGINNKVNHAMTYV